jgi:hypothetical protein
MLAHDDLRWPPVHTQPAYEPAGMDYNRRVAGESALIDWRKYCVHSC